MGVTNAQRGIIPARAGFTCGALRSPICEVDHPRSRGVYPRVDEGFRGDAGSSPLARGLQRRIQGASKPLRIIPARAGFTPECSSPPRKPRDHPRSRGVYEQLSRPGDLMKGSSPLARGLQHRELGPENCRRIIPARAGFTHEEITIWLEDGDHPRSRGVYLEEDSGLVAFLGSSPLARGLLHDHADRRLDAGIIPARAGFTHLLRSGCADS